MDTVKNKRFRMEENMNNKEYNETTKKIIEKVGCKHQVFTQGSTGQEIEKAYFEALERGRKEGFSPVIVVSDDTLEEWFGILEDEDSYSKDDVLNSKEAKEDGKEYLEQRYKEYIEDYLEDSGMEEEMEEMMGEMDEDELALEHFIAYQSYKGEGLEEVILFEIPVKNPWEIPAWLPMGGWNECPAAEEMIAVAKYWYEKYGAVIATVSHDTLEFYVEKKVSDGEQAMELAKEQYSFCPDCVDQGVGTIGQLCESIKNSNVWFFWWD